MRVNDTNSRSGNSRWASGAGRHLGAIQVNPEGLGRFPWHKVVFFCRGDRDSYEQVIQTQLSGLETLDIDLLRRCILMSETDLAEAVKVFGQGISIDRT